MRAPKSALPGSKFGRLTVLSVEPEKKRKCKCDCGNIITTLAGNLVTGNTTSCGCYAKEIYSSVNVTHGHSKGKKRSKVFDAWHNMMARCYNSKNNHYKRYGGRGIKVCAAWKNKKTGFAQFLIDMGEPPSSKHSLDRIENDGNYEPSNCRWVIEKTQARNKSSNRLITFNGKKQSLADWADELKIPYFTLHSRLKRGKSVKEAFKKESK